MRILLFTIDYKPNKGGISEVLHEYAKGMAKKGHEVTVLAPNIAGGAAFDRRQPFKIVRYPDIPFLGPILSLFFLIQQVINYRPDVVISGMWYPCGIYCSWLKGFLPLRYIVVTYAVDVLDSTSSLMKRIKSILRPVRIASFNRSDGVITISRYTETKLVQSGVRKSLISLIPPGIDLDAFYPERPKPSLIKRMGITRKKVILTVARLQDYKGVDMVIKAMPSVLKKHPDAVYLVIGGGEDEDRLRNLINQLGLQKQVILFGWYEGHLREIYALCDLFVMVSREDLIRPDVEGFGIVFTEANACGKPTIGGDSGGIPDAVIDGKTGVLVDPEDPAAVSKAIIKMLDNPSLRERLGKQGMAQSKTLSYPRIIDRLESLLKSTMESTKKRRREAP